MNDGPGSLFCETQAARLSTAVELAQADARMGRSVNTVEIERIRAEYEAEIERLRASLAFYADPANWNDPEPEVAQGVEYRYSCPAVADGGETAREALAVL